jgi:hypothetical protein
VTARGEEGTEASAEQMSWEGFTENTVHPSRLPAGTLSADTSLVLSRYYDRIVSQVTYAAPDADAGTVPAAADAAFEQTVTVLPGEGLVRGSELFKNWNTKADGSGTTYHPGEEFSMPASPVALYAQYGDYSIGETGPAGGTVFYIDSADSFSGWKYLEAAAAETEFTSTIFGYERAVYNGTNILVGTATAVGTGEANTLALVTAMGSSVYVQSFSTGTTASYAAKLCSDLVSNGFDDWFLPSKDELSLIYQNLAIPGLGGFTRTLADRYWSSSEVDAQNAYYHKFETNNSWATNRGNPLKARAVRAF